ncbi:MAG: Phage integrase family [Conexibacter sp.]|nr:Phage integrase family [Conexibacter sp.]
MADRKARRRTDTPGVYRRGNTYTYTYRVDGRQRWGTAPTLAAARRAKRQAEADADRGVIRDEERIRFGDYARQWIDTYQGRTANGFRPGTRRWYRQVLEHRLIPYFDSRRMCLSDIRPRDVKAFVVWLLEQEDPRRPGRKLAKASIRQHVAVLRALLADATEEDLIRANPASGIRVAVPEGEGTGRPLTEPKQAMTAAQLRAVIDEVPAEWRLFFEFLAHTGLRIAEAIEVRWGRDLVLDEQPVLKVRWQFTDGQVREPKTRYGKRDIPMSPRLVARLVEAAGGEPPDGELVFKTSVGTRVDRRNIYNHVLGPAARRAGLPWVTLHTFRHTCASLLFAPAERGGGAKNAKQVQAWLGHHSAAFTLQQYVHLVDAGMGEADFFDTLLAG